MKIKVHLLALLALCSGLAITTNAAAKNNKATEQQEVRVMEIKNRVDQIREMDISQLNKDQRISLKRELKDMKAELRQMGPIVIVMSVGVLILIIVLLLLLL